VVDEHDVAQAVELVRALCDQLHAMTRQLSRLERQGVTGTNGRALATIRREAAALRRDISKAQFLIDRLQRCYLNGNGRAHPATKSSHRHRRRTEPGPPQSASE
jgi:hypothetical protein